MESTTQAKTAGRVGVHTRLLPVALQGLLRFICISVHGSAASSRGWGVGKVRSEGQDTQDHKHLTHC